MKRTIALVALALALQGYGARAADIDWKKVDAALGKTTFVTQLGVDGAKQRVRDLLARADSALSIFGAKGEVLRAAARFVADRKN